MKGVLPWLVRWACRAGIRDFCSVVATLVGPVQNNFSSPYTISIHMSPTPSKLDRQPCWVACLLVCVSCDTLGALPSLAIVKRRWRGCREMICPVTEASKETPNRLIWQELLSWKLLSAPGAGFEHLHSTTRRQTPYSSSSQGSQVNTLVYLCRLSTDTNHSDSYWHTLYSCMRGEEARSKYNHIKEYWMFYRGPGFLAVVRFGSSPLPLQSTSCHSSSVLCIVCRRSNLLTGEGGGKDQVIRPKESLVLYKSFNILWIMLLDFF